MTHDYRALVIGPDLLDDEVAQLKASKIDALAGTSPSEIRLYAETVEEVRRRFKAVLPERELDTPWRPMGHTTPWDAGPETPS